MRMFRTILFGVCAVLTGLLKITRDSLHIGIVLSKWRADKGRDRTRDLFDCIVGPELFKIIISTEVSIRRMGGANLENSEVIWASVRVGRCKWAQVCDAT